MTAHPGESRNLGQNPCLMIQADLSAMLDGELDQKSVHRVLVHSDGCPSCRDFLTGIRAQVRSHRQLHEVLGAADEDFVEIDRGLKPHDGRIRVRASELRQELTRNRRQLARILYELGRGFVLMGISPEYSRVVLREPVPIPDTCRRGRNLLDEIERAAELADLSRDLVRAKEAFGDDLLVSPESNLRKGIALLHDCLLLDPGFAEASIYLGHAHFVTGEHSAAIAVFESVLDTSTDPVPAALARMHLGNVYLEQSRPDLAEDVFKALVDSGAVGLRPQFGLIYLNLALAVGYQGRFDDCFAWLQRLHRELPHKQRMVAEELRANESFLRSLEQTPGVYSRFSTDFPFWFPAKEAS